MPHYRRIVEIETNDGANQFKTFFWPAKTVPTVRQAKCHWRDLLEKLRNKYNTRTKFSYPRPDQDLPDFMGPLPGESGWEWDDDEDVEEVEL